MRDVRQEREGVPVIDRLVEPTDPLVLHERGHGLRDERPDERGTDDEREHRRGEARRALAADARRATTPSPRNAT